MFKSIFPLLRCDTVLTKAHILSRCLHFHQVCVLCSVRSSRMTHTLSWHASLGSFLAIRVSQTVPVIDNLKVLRNTIQIYCGRHFYWNLPADFSLIKLGLWFWEEDHRNRVLLKSTSYQATYFLFNF